MKILKKYSLESVETLFASEKSQKWHSGLKCTFDQKISKTFQDFKEIAFWCTFDQKISKTFQDFKVWIKSGLKVTFSA